MRIVTDHALARLAGRNAFVLLASLVLAQQGGTAFGQMPNIVYILADDMGLGDVRSYNANSPVNTPNIDRIANAGMRFTDAHTSNSVCTPTRYSILTGQYAWRATGSGVLNPYAGSIVDPQRLTVAEMLQSSGYSTGMFGKWHLGMNWVTTNGQAALANGSNVNHSQPVARGPLDNGFDTFFGVEGSTNYPPYAFIRDRLTVGSDLVTPTAPTGQVAGNPSNPSLNWIGPIAPGFNITDVLPATTNEAASYISSKANQANPFFAYIPLTAPHEPVLPPSSAIIGSSGYTGPKQSYADFIWAVDWAVGKVLDTLADPDHNVNTNDSIIDNTLVIFTSDNGATKNVSFNTSTGFANGVPLRGEKSTIFEAGNREPFLAQWGGHIPAGTVNNHLVETNDFMATAANLVGYNLPSNAAEDSVNILPELLGTATTPRRQLSVGQSVNGALNIHQMDTAGNEWKLIFTASDGGSADNQKFDPRNTITDFTKLQLYNLTSDPGEQTNLLSGGGNPASQQKTLQLQQYMQGYTYAGRSANFPPRTGTNGVTTMLLDFGDSSQQTSGTGWNNFSGTTSSRPTDTKGLYDQGGGYTGILLKTSWVASGIDAGVASLANAYNGPFPASLSDMPYNALNDAFYVRNGNTVTFSVEALDAHATYDFEFYAAASSGPTYSLFTLTGSTTQQTHISPVSGNSSIVATVNGMMPDAQNRIQILLEGRQLDGVTIGTGFLNFMRIIEHLLEVPGDFNNDRFVDSADYSAWQQAYGTVGVSPADGNHDNIVDTADFLIWRRAMSTIGVGSGVGQGQSYSQAVPEPAQAQLAIIAAVALFATGAWRGALRRRAPLVCGARGGRLV